MTNRIQMSLVGLYVVGWFIDWAYWISVGWEWSVSEGGYIHALPVFFGWLPAFFWPLHLGSEVWNIILS